VSVSGRALNYNDLDGDGLFAQFTGKEMKFVQAAFARVNAPPSAEDMRDFFGSMTTT
jgi:hypothetical protein